MGRGEIAGNEQFLLFPQCFLPMRRTVYHFHQIQNYCLQILSVWKSLKFVVWERVKHSQSIPALLCLQTPAGKEAMNIDVDVGLMMKLQNKVKTLEKERDQLQSKLEKLESEPKTSSLKESAFNTLKVGVDKSLGFVLGNCLKVYS